MREGGRYSKRERVRERDISIMEEKCKFKSNLWVGRTRTKEKSGFCVHDDVFRHGYRKKCSDYIPLALHLANDGAWTCDDVCASSFWLCAAPLSSRDRLRHLHWHTASLISYHQTTDQCKADDLLQQD